MKTVCFSEDKCLMIANDAMDDGRNYSTEVTSIRFYQVRPLITEMILLLTRFSHLFISLV